MTTDNRTNGQIVAKALVAHCEDHKMPFPRGSIKKIVEALRVAGRLAGEPTEAQVEAAGAERDAALARIAKLEAELAASDAAFRSLKVSTGPTDARLTRAEARIAEAAKLHRKRKHCNPDREDVFVCDECTRINRYGIAHWPCPTAVALGLNEGESE